MKKIFLILVFTVLFSIQPVSAWQNTTFNNSLGTERIDFLSAGSFMRYLSVPQNSFLSHGQLSITYPAGLSFPSNVLHYYALNETTRTNATDELKTYNGTIDVGVKVNSPGKIGTAYHFNGTGHGITLFNQTAANISISFWVNLSSNLDGAVIFSKAGVISLYSNWTGSNSKMMITKDTDPILTGNLIKNHEWTMITIVANSSNIYLYTNGTLFNSTNWSGVTSNANPFLFGKSGAPYLNGSLDEIGFWNKTLAATEVSALYNLGNGVSYNSLATGGAGEMNLTIGGENISTVLISNISESSNITANLSNLHTYINSYLPTCSYSNGYCQVPFNFSSTVGGVFVIYSNISFDTFSFTENSQSFNVSSYETEKEGFEINLTYDSSYYTNILANLIYNGTSYAGTKVGNGDNVLFTKSVYVPLDTGNKEFYWEVRLYNQTTWEFYNSTFKNQSIGLINFSFCSGANTIHYINFTFKNETTAQESILSTFVSTFWYWLGVGEVNKSYSYTHLAENKSYGFCFYPANRTLHLLTSTTYSNSESPQREYREELTLTNVTTNKTLYLLPNSLGTYVTFQTINQAQQVVTGVLITVSSSALGTLESKATDTSGGATFFLNPLTSYTITATKEGYANNSFVITPTQSQYTITMQQTSTTHFVDLMKGIAFGIEPKIGELKNGTTYEFNFTIASTYWSLDSFGFILTNGSYTIGSASSTTITGGTVRTNVNTGDNKTIVMNYYWTVNGTTSNASASWYIRNTYGESYSLFYLFSDLKKYIDSGFFGMTNFTLALLIFFAIFIFVGVLSYKFGITSPAAIMGVITGIVALFDYGFNLIPVKYGLATWVIFIITFGYAAWEWSR